MLAKDKFLGYFHEIENYGFRSERFFEDLNYLTKDPNITPIKRMLVMTEWLQASYEAGYEQGLKDASKF